MRCSIIILNWNRPDDTIRAVNSVLDQRDPDCEILVWDNASSDGSYHILCKTFKDQQQVRVIQADANYGVAGGRNRAVQQCQGDIIVFLDNDAVFINTDAITLITDYLRDNPTIDALSFEIVRPDNHLMWPFSRPVTPWRHKTFDIFRVDGCGFAIRLKSFVKAGMFAEHFSPYGAEDAHFGFKLINTGARIVYFPPVQVEHRFELKGRHGNQFAMHVRNSLWIPMELFPGPHALISTLKKAAEFFVDALQHRLLTAYLQGMFDAIYSFKRQHRQPLSKTSWKRFRSMVQQEKHLSKAA